MGDGRGRASSSSEALRSLVGLVLPLVLFGCAVETAEPPDGALQIEFEQTGTTNATLAPFQIAPGEELTCQESGHGGVVGSSGAPTVTISGTHNEQTVQLVLPRKSDGQVPTGRVSARVHFWDKNLRPEAHWSWVANGCADCTGAVVVDHADDDRIEFHLEGLAMQPGSYGSVGPGEGTFSMSGRGWARRPGSRGGR